MNSIRRILLVDDSPDDRADFRQMLLRGSGQRYHFTEAELGREGLREVRHKQQARQDELPFDCILLDFHLPDMNALEVLAALCSGTDLPPCPVVVITGWNGADRADGPRMLRAGAQDYIGKSWSTSESLTRAIENSIERYDLLIKRKAAEAELRESEKRYRDLFNSIDDGFCVLEKIEVAAGQPVNFRYADVNFSFTAQFGMAGAVGKTMRQMLPDEPEEWFATYDSVCTTGIPTRIERSYPLQKCVLELYTFRIGGPESRKVAIIFNDITERRHAELQTLEQAQVLADLDRRKDEFLAMLSHELRNPLAPISNAVHLLRLQAGESPLQKQARVIIERQLGRLNHLVDDLLEISRITTGRIQLRRERIAISGLLEQAIETVQPLIAQQRHVLTVSLPEQPVWLHADAARLEQVMVNLLTNAAKYTDEGGRIMLSVQTEGDTAVLRVRDTGIGIAAELLPRVFDLFTQAERSLDRSQGGLGIGLCLVQRLVELHGGSVSANSVLGQGSEFVVRLPMLLSEEPPLALRLNEQVPLASQHCQVLVVDDNEDAAQTLGILLEMSGHEVRMAYDGISALKAALAWQPDVVLLDIGLPGMTGLEVARKIRQHAMQKHITLVALTGYGQETDRQRSLEAGFDHHLAKPADFKEVEEILNAVAQAVK
ncbi:MAG: hypothetical protein JWR60_2850 [Polaromonas sp.]|nr:hypothetical protein [Polaromonas sp.]